VATKQRRNMNFGNGNSGTEIVISTPLRTAIGTFSGTLRDVPAVDLGTTVAQEVFNRSGLDPEQVDEAIMGNPAKEGLPRTLHWFVRRETLKEIGRTTK
jgi:hypothetical protein